MLLACENSPRYPVLNKLLAKTNSVSEHNLQPKTKQKAYTWTSTFSTSSLPMIFFYMNTEATGAPSLRKVLQFHKTPKVSVQPTVCFTPRQTNFQLPLHQFYFKNTSVPNYPSTTFSTTQVGRSFQKGFSFMSGVFSKSHQPRLATHFSQFLCNHSIVFLHPLLLPS